MKLYIEDEHVEDEHVATIPLKVLTVAFALDLLIIGAVVWFLRAHGIL